MYLVRVFVVWLLIIFAETIHGTLRQLFLAHVVGDFPARRIGVFVGMILIFVIALFFVRWIAAPTTGSLFAVGLLWTILTLAFEIALNRFLGLTRERIFEDYDITRRSDGFRTRVYDVRSLAGGAIEANKNSGRGKFLIYVKSRKFRKHYRTIRSSPPRRAYRRLAG